MTSRDRLARDTAAGCDLNLSEDQAAAVELFTAFVRALDQRDFNTQHNAGRQLKLLGYKVRRIRPLERNV